MRRLLPPPLVVSASILGFLQQLCISSRQRLAPKAQRLELTGRDQQQSNNTGGIYRGSGGRKAVTTASSSLHGKMEPPEDNLKADFVGLPGEDDAEFSDSHRQRES